EMDEIVEYLSLVDSGIDLESATREYLRFTLPKQLYGEWDLFQDNEHEVVIVKAARGAGKTYNIARKIVDSDFERVAWIGSNHHQYFIIARELERQSGTINQRPNGRDIIVDDKHIHY